MQSALQAAQIHATGDVRIVKDSAWSRVIRVTTDIGVVYLKLSLAGSKHEIALTELIARLAPHACPAVLACNPAESWLLLRDGGGDLRKAVRASKDFSLWKPVLVHYATLQQRMAAHVPGMLAIGVPDRRLQTLPAHYENLLADSRWLRVGQPRGLGRNEYDRLIASRAKVRALCARLAAAGIPESLNHGDLGDANVFVGGTQPLFFDWGDAVVSHPFFSLRTTLVSLYWSLGLDTGSLELEELVGHYLSCWPQFGTVQQLRPAMRAALALASINGALTWRATLMHHADATIADYTHTVPALLQEFLALADGALR